MCNIAVAPLVGAWIEIDKEMENIDIALVAPLVGAWIEIKKDLSDCRKCKVAPLVGAWIEMERKCRLSLPELRRSSRGSVD